MIDRYSLPEMGRVWSEENRFRRMLDVEIAAVLSMADEGLVPRKAARNVARKASFRVDEIRRIEKTTKHDVTAFLKSAGKRLGADARFLHLGLTSSDVVDSGLSLQMRDAFDLVIPKAEKFKSLLRRRALEFKKTPVIGRTHGVHAEPTTFGLKLLVYALEMQRDITRLRRAREAVAVGKLSGAVGTNASVSPSVERKTLTRLGLGVAPVSTQVLQRDRHAEAMWALAMLGATLEKIALEIRHLQRTEVREAEEGFSEGQTGSSAMPHKKNPVNCERVCGLARVLRGNLNAALENVALWHERDISHSSVERIILPDGFLLADFMLEEMARIVRTLNVYPLRMLENIAITRGLVFSQNLLLACIAKGIARFDAYRIVQALAMKAWKDPSLDLKTLARLDGRLKRVLAARDIETIFDMKGHLKHTDAIFKRALKEIEP